MDVTWNTVQRGLFPHSFEKYINSFLGGGSFLPGLRVLILCLHFIESNPEKSDHLVQ